MAVRTNDYLFVLLSTLAVLPSAAAAQSVIGVNEAANVPQHPEQRLADLARRGRRWRNGALGLTVGAGDFYALGVYSLTWSGEADVKLSAGRGVAQLLREAPHRRQYRIASHHKAGLTLRHAGVEPVSVTLVCEGVATEGPFTKAFLDELRQFDVWRTMDLSATNGSRQVDWSDRPTLNSRVGEWFEHGWPWELQIDAANRAGVDLWLCLPHAANDQYVRELAKLVAAKLSPERQLYLEYSNEVWNYGPAFKQSRWLLRELAGGTPANRHWAYGRRSAEVWQHFAQHAPAVQLRRVLAGQAAVVRVLEQALEGANSVGVRPDVLSCAAYFNPGKEGLYERDRDKTAAFELMRQSIEVTRQPWWQSHGKLAMQLGLPLIAYEGGSHTAAASGRERKDAKYVAWLHELNRDERICDSYRRLRATWRAAGGSGLLYFQRLAGPTKFGSWGHREYAGDNAPKQRAIEEHLAEVHPP